MLLTFAATSSPAINAGLPLLLGVGGECTLSKANLDAIAAAVWAVVLEGTLTAAQIQRIKLAAIAGQRQGLGTATEEYLAQDGVTPRVTFTPSDAAGNGTTVVDGS